VDFMDDVCVDRTNSSGDGPKLTANKTQVLLSLVHTFPFIIYNIQQGTMSKQWSTNVFYWTGTAAIIPQAWLCFMSLRPIRCVCVCMVACLLSTIR
jgi:hypothetical protein